MTYKNNRNRFSITTTCLLLTLALIAFFAASPGEAQTVSGQVSGTVTDSSGAVIAGAKVALTSTLTNQSRDVVSASSGDFVFTEVLPGTYTLSISATGFQGYKQSSVLVTPSERVALHEIHLTVGSVTEQISVEATSAHVETDSSEHSSEITAKQFIDIPDRGRNFVDYLALVPGTTTLTQSDAPGGGNIGFNGAENQSMIQLDGVMSQDTGAPQGVGFQAPNIDAISEVKVLTGAVPAEYGVRPEGSIVVSVKSGTRNFHGSLYEYNRNDAYNANTYFNKLNGIRRQPYKYNNPGGTFGGPVLIPGTNFNKNRDRLFFFGSGDFLFRHVPTSATPSSFVVPTLAERKGNFGLTNTSAVTTGSFHCPNGGSPTSLNPLTCPGSAPSAAGINLMALLPTPTCNRPATNDVAANTGITLPTCASNANWVGSFVGSQPHKDYIVRVDYQLTKRNLFYARALQDFTGTDNAFALGGAAWGQLRTNYDIPSRGWVATLVSTIRPNLVNELVLGGTVAWARVRPATPAMLTQNQRANVGLGSSVLPTLYPNAQNNPLGMLPNTTFGGGSFVGSPANITVDDRFPFYGTHRTYNATDSLAWTHGRHNFKIGIYYENSPRKESVAGSNYNGSINFAVTSASSTCPPVNPTCNPFSNPLDTGYSYANAYLGSLQSYTESSARPDSKIAIKNTQAFVQDNWKVSRRVSLDLGLRIYHTPTPNSRDNTQLSHFDPTVYSKAAQPQLIQPGQAGFPASAVGLFLPGTGTPFQGMVLTTHRIRNDPPVGFAPRFGFAWDVMGNGKTAIRGGFGAFYDTLVVVLGSYSYIISPPAVVTPQLFNTTISSLSGATGLLGPTSVLSTPTNYQSPMSYQYNLGFQRSITPTVLLDVSYVGNQNRHGSRGGPTCCAQPGDQINALPYGIDFSNPTLAGRPNLLRPYLGYGAIQISNLSVSGNYNSLQVQLNKRVGRLTAGGSYTVAKLLDDSSTRVLGVGVPLDRYYGPGNNDRRHNLVFNFSYALTGAMKGEPLWMRETVGGWNIQGLANFVSGSPSALSGSFAYDINGASAAGNQGGPVALNRLANTVLPSGKRAVTAGHAPQYLNLASVGVPTGGPGSCTLGTAPTACGLGNMPFKGAFYGPGINNWDISLFKNFQLAKAEGRFFQLRLETYNTFNHTQFSGVNSSVSVLANQTIAPVSTQNSTFGQFNGTQPARILVVAGKFYF